MQAFVEDPVNVQDLEADLVPGPDGLNRAKARSLLQQLLSLLVFVTAASLATLYLDSLCHLSRCTHLFDDLNNSSDTTATMD